MQPDIPPSSSFSPMTLLLAHEEQQTVPPPAGMSNLDVPSSTTHRPQSLILPNGFQTSPSTLEPPLPHRPQSITVPDHFQPSPSTLEPPLPHRPKSIIVPDNFETSNRKSMAYPPVSEMTMSRSSKQQNRMSRAVNENAYAIQQLNPDDLPCESGDSHEFVGDWTCVDFFTAFLCCPCYCFSSCICTYLYRSPRQDTWNGSGCKGTGRKTCVKCKKSWEEVEVKLNELKERAGPAPSHPQQEISIFPPSGPGGGLSNWKGPPSNKDRLRPPTSK